MSDIIFYDFSNYHLIAYVDKTQRLKLITMKTKLFFWLEKAKLGSVISPLFSFFSFWSGIKFEIGHFFKKKKKKNLYMYVFYWMLEL